MTGTILLVIGVTLMRVAINWSAGGNPTLSGPEGPIPNPSYGAPLNLAIALLVLGMVLVITKFAKGFIRNVSVLLSIICGFTLTIMMGKVDFGGIDDVRWLSLVYPFAFGPPKFDLWASLTICVVMMIMMIEAIGTFLALGEITGREISEEDLTRGIRADGAATVIGGMMNSFCYTTYSQNIGLIQITRVNSRWVCAVSGCILIFLGFLPKIAFIVASVPQYVLGGAGIVMFGMVAATGVRIISKTNFATNDKTLYIIAISLGIGLIPLISESFFDQMPEVLGPLLHSGIILATITAVGLNIFFNGISKAKADHSHGMSPTNQTAGSRR